jgi:hypothetical protein
MGRSDRLDVLFLCCENVYDLSAARPVQPKFGKPYPTAAFLFFKASLKAVAFMSLDSTPIQLDDLLDKIWTHHAKREFRFCRLVVRQAARIALESLSHLSVSIESYPYNISFDSDGRPQEPVIPSPDNEPEFTDDIADRARQAREARHELTKRVAQGQDVPVHWIGGEVSLALLDQPEYLPIHGNYALAYVWMDQRVSRDFLAMTPWTLACNEYLHATNFPSCTREILKNYAEWVCSGDVDTGHQLTSDVYRLEDAGFTERLLESLQERFPKEYESMKLPQPEINQEGKFGFHGIGQSESDETSVEVKTAGEKEGLDNSQITEEPFNVVIGKGQERYCLQSNGLSSFSISKEPEMIFRLLIGPIASGASAEWVSFKLLNQVAGVDDPEIESKASGALRREISRFNTELDSWVKPPGGGRWIDSLRGSG